VVEIKLTVVLRPLLTPGVYATNRDGDPVILVDSEQTVEEQVKTLAHELAHLLGIRDEAEAERVAEYATKKTDA